MYTQLSTKFKILGLKLLESHDYVTVSQHGDCVRSPSGGERSNTHNAQRKRGWRARMGRTSNTQGGWGGLRGGSGAVCARASRALGTDSQYRVYTHLGN